MFFTGKRLINIAIDQPLIFLIKVEIGHLVIVIL